MDQTSHSPINQPNQERQACCKQIEYTKSPVTVLPDGTRIAFNDNGDIVFINHASGAKVVRMPSYTLCETDSAEHWLGIHKTWFRLD